MAKVTMRQIAATIGKPESTVYRWKKDNPPLFTAVKEYAERLYQQKIDNSVTID